MPEPEPPPFPPAEKTLFIGDTLSGSAKKGAQRVHYLVVVEGQNRGFRIQIGALPLSIGRGPPSEVVLQDSEMSRAHCRIYVRLADVLVTDLNSTNGTFIDEVRVEGSMVLPTGAMLQIGRHVLRHEYRDKAEVDQSMQLDRDLEDASRYVQALLPPPSRSGPLLTDWLLLPSTTLGGDAFGYHAVDSQTFAIYLVDVSGHGAAAAMHSVSVINVLRHHALPRTDFRKPAQVLRNLNCMFPMDQHGGMLFTIWYGVYETSKRTLAFASAGHHPAYLIDSGRTKITPLQTRNPLIGASPDYLFRAQTTTIEPLTSFYLFSDGVFEIVTRENKPWRLSEFLPYLLEDAVSGLTEPERLHQVAKSVALHGSFDDDFSMLFVTFV